jgi:tetratricopeptide (TPR) repeat protein
MTEAEEGRTRSALADFEVAVDLTPADPEPWLWKGVLHDQLGEASEADDAFEQAESVYGSPLDFLLNRGRVYLQVGDVGKAQADIDAAIDLDPASGWAHYLQAGVAMRKDDYTTALAELDRALELARESGDSELQVMAASQKARLAQLQPSDSD